MALEIKTDLENVDWERLAQVYAAAFSGIQTAELIETIFRRSYATRIGLWNGQIVSGVYAFSDGELDASIHGLCVHPDFQRLGIGRVTMLSLLEEFPPHIALLLTAEEKHWDFYRSVGFRRLHTAMARGFPEGDMEVLPVTSS
jgi:ribosomal protein S18 acetylase RimI-like enzyme